MNESEECIERVRKFISEKGMKAELLVLKSSCRSAREASVAVDVDISSVVKTILFECSSKTIACIMCGNDRVSTEKISKICGAKPRLLNGREIFYRTGYPAGGVPPFGYCALYIMDQRVTEMKEIYCGGGSERALVKTTPEEILKVNCGIVKDVRAYTK